MCFNCGTSLLSVAGATTLRFMLKRENKKLEEGASIGKDGRLVDAETTRLREEQGLERDGLDKDFRFLL
jgi:hypothetical protein